MTQKIEPKNRVTALVAGMGILWVWLMALTWAQLKSAELGATQSSLLFGHLAGTILLVLLLIPFSRFIFPVTVRNEHWKGKDAVILGLAIVILYVVVAMLENYLGTGTEAFVERLKSYKGMAFLSTCLTIFLLAPVGEELLFRGILLSPFTHGSRALQVIGILITSSIFLALHMQYNFLLTHIELFVCAVIFCIARIRSGGLVLPIALHILASIMAVLV